LTGYIFFSKIDIDRVYEYMKIFDYSFLLDGMFPVDILNYIKNIAVSQEKEERLKEVYFETFMTLEDIAKIESVISSNEIEGIITSRERAIEILKLGKAPNTHDEKEILGYKDALKLIHENHYDLDINEYDIKQLHRVLLAQSDNEGGEYKQVNNGIYRIIGGVPKLHFETISYKETPQAMEQLIGSFIYARQNGANDLLLLPCFILDFLSIHPFIDGNGRTSRLLSLLLMYKAGYDVGKYISFEGKINQYKAQYYQALSESSIGWHENQNSYIPFIKNFLWTLMLCYKDLQGKFTGVGKEKATKKERVRGLILNSPNSLSKKEIQERLPDISAVTITKALIELEKSGLIKKVGTGTNIKYIKNK